MNAEKLAKLQQQVRIGGRGSARRKKKVVHRSSTTDDKKLQSSLKKLAVSNISGIEEVNMIKDDGSVIHFNNPKVQASLSANTFAVSGHAENKQITEMLPGILNHLGAEGFNQLKRLASSVNAANATSGGADDDDDDVPELVEDFEAASKNDTATEKKDEKVQIKLEETPAENKTTPIEKVEEISSTEQITEAEKKSTDKTEVIKEETVTQQPVAKEE